MELDPTATCPNCQYTFPAGASNCPSCDTSMIEVPARELIQQPSSDSARKVR
jgi:predicted Zn-ribbon and HTH transcriptional regulator